MATRTALAVASIVFAAGAGCSSEADPPPNAAPRTLTLASVAWNPADADVGGVVDVVEEGQTLAIFGSKGVVTFTSGAVASTDSSITDWRSAGAIPSPDGVTTWLVGIDGSGRLRRVSDAGEPVDVSDRYGVGADKVTSVGSAGSIVTFVLEGGIAIADGKTVTHYPGAQPRSLAMSKDVVAIADGTAVRTFDHGKERDVALPDAQLVAYDPTGHLLAATSHALYDLSASYAMLRDDLGARTIHQLAAAGAGVWLAVDGDLVRWSEGQLSYGTGAAITPDARLVPSPSGDVWVVSGGKLQRWSIASAAASEGDDPAWTSALEPIYAAVCSNCHGPVGSGKSSSNIDLSTYGAWKERRAEVYARVVSQAGTAAAMPPPASGFVLTAAQRAAIEAWSKP